MGAFFTSLLGNFPLLVPTIQSGPWRPPQWNLPQLYSMTCTLPGTPSANVSSSSSVGGVTTPGSASSTSSPGTPSTTTTYFFDAVLRAEHNQEAVGTKHPVQIGPAIVDHVYLMPARVVLEVGMSDAMDSFMAGQYSGARSKSVSAYQTFKQIQAARVPITLATRLDQYQNMWLQDVRATETNVTAHAARVTLYFEQIISAQTSSVTTSARPDQTGATNLGTKAPGGLSTSETNQLNSLAGAD